MLASRMDEAMDLRGRVALVTGASRGLGLELSRALARAGVKVAMVARDPAVLAAAVQRVRVEGGVAEAIAADVGDPLAAIMIAARTHAVLGAPSIVIHNASTLGTVPLPLLGDTDPSVFAETFAVNVIGPFALSRVLVGTMVLGGSGVIVHVSSDAAIEAYPRWGAYGASKAALDHLARIWGAELDGTGVRVLAIDPGEMDTQMHADAIPDADPASLQRPASVAARIVALLGDVTVGTGVRVAANHAEVAA
jgi:NAD(P)-dependent dehydrogenase (short-subunit alcohol dehydrogenase family)